MINTQRITTLQEDYGYIGMQAMINDGSAWKLEGSVGRHAMSLLESGVCMLPKKAHYDAYGNKVPSRDELKKGTKGTYQNAKRFWERVCCGEIDLLED